MARLRPCMLRCDTRGQQEDRLKPANSVFKGQRSPKKRERKKRRMRGGLTVSQCIIPHVVTRAVRINEHQNSHIRRTIRRIRLRRRLRILHANRPPNIAQEQRSRAQQVHDPPPHFNHQHGYHRSANQTPARDAHIDLLNRRAIGEANHFEQVA